MPDCHHRDITITEKTYVRQTVLSVPSYCLLFSIRGNCDIETPQGSLVIGQDDAVLLQPSIVCTLKPDKDFQTIEIAFTRDAFLRTCLPVLTGCPLMNCFFVRETDPREMSYLHFRKIPMEIRRIVEIMLEEQRQHRQYHREMLLCTLSGLLIQMNRSCFVDAMMTEPPNSQRVQQMVDYLVANFRDVSLKSMAAVFHYHPNTIAALIKKGTGKTFSQLLTQTRMSCAAQILADGNTPVKVVARACGYDNISHFYTLFRRHFGMTPGEYAEMADIHSEE